VYEAKPGSASPLFIRGAFVQVQRMLVTAANGIVRRECLTLCGDFFSGHVRSIGGVRDETGIILSV